MNDIDKECAIVGVETNDNNEEIDLVKLGIPLLVSSKDADGNDVLSYKEMYVDDHGNEKVMNHEVPIYSSVLPIPFGYGEDMNHDYGYTEKNGGKFLIAVDGGEGAQTLLYKNYETKEDAVNSTYNECQIAGEYVKSIKNKLKNNDIIDVEIRHFYIIASLFNAHGEFSQKESQKHIPESKLGLFHEQLKPEQKKNIFLSKSLEGAYYKIYTELKKEMYLHLLNNKIIKGETQADGTVSSNLLSGVDSSDYSKVTLILKEIGIRYERMIADDDFMKEGGLYAFMRQNFNSVGEDATLDDLNVQIAYFQYINNKSAIDKLFENGNVPQKNEVTQYVDASLGKETKKMFITELQKLK